MSAAKFGPTPKLIPSGSELIELKPSSAKYLRQIGHVPCYKKNINNKIHVYRKLHLSGYTNYFEKYKLF